MSGHTRHSGMDEDDIRVRAGRGSRPRTRRRPAHQDAAGAFVVAVDRGRYRCLIDGHAISAMKARELGRGNIVVGDTVSLAGDITGAPGTLARVVRIEPRRSVLRRSADDTDPVERIVVANADQLVIVCALADPPPRLRLIDRFLAAAYDAGLEPVLCLTKADLAGPEAILPVYSPLGFRSRQSPSCASCSPGS
jgi:ribosome biogenesis GTPase / thiamine phosphate phosphatase